MNKKIDVTSSTRNEITEVTEITTLSNADPTEDQVSKDTSGTPLLDVVSLETLTRSQTTLTTVQDVNLYLNTRTTQLSTTESSSMAVVTSPITTSAAKAYENTTAISTSSTTSTSTSTTTTKTPKVKIN